MFRQLRQLSLIAFVISFIYVLFVGSDANRRNGEWMKMASGENFQYNYTESAGGYLTALNFKQLSRESIASLPSLKKWDAPKIDRKLRCVSSSEVFNSAGILHNWTDRVIQGRLFVVFPYNAELDWTEIQLQSLHHIVDYFVVVESRRTFTGHTRELVFEQLMKTRFRHFQSQVIIVNDDGQTDALQFDFEQYQLDKIWAHLTSTSKIKSGDVLVVTHGDAILLPEACEVLKSCWPPTRSITQEELNEGLTTEARWRHIRIPHREAYYGYEYLSSNQRLGPSRTTATVINSDLRLDLTLMDLMVGGCQVGLGTYKVKQCFFDQLWHERFIDLNLTVHDLSDEADPFAVWHCSWCFGTLDDFRNKLATSSHTEIGESVTTDQEIIDLVRKGTSPYLPPYRYDFAREDPLEVLNAAPPYVSSEFKRFGRFGYLLQRHGLENAGFSI